MSIYPLCKVTDAKTGKLKRYETNSAKTVAIVQNGVLKITPLGSTLGFHVVGNYIYKGETRAF